MAEYYPLLDRAVSGLAEPSADARRTIYERARAALLGQLRRMDPPIPDDAIARESDALDEAIARLELKFAAGPDRRPPPPERPAARPLPTEARVPRAPARPVRTAEPAPPPPSPPSPTGTMPPVVPPPSRERPMPGERPAPAIGGDVKAPVPPRAPATRPTSQPGTIAPLPPGPRGVRPVMALRPVSPRPSTDIAGLPPAGMLPISADAPAPSDTSAAPRTTFADALDEARRGEPGLDDDEAHDDPAAADLPRAAPARPRDTARPPAPRPAQPVRFGWKFISGSALVAVVMIGTGIAAYRMRDRPEQVIANHTEVQTSEGTNPGKIVDRAPGPEGSGAGGADAGSGSTEPAPAGQPPDGTDTPADAGPAIAVAQRAALLVDAPEDPQKVRTYVGNVVWHFDSVNAGQGQPLATAVKAEIDVPDAKLKVTMLMQRNPEPQLPASHTIEFHFLPEAGNTLGSVKQINVPEMRRDDDAPTGDPLAGVPVAIKDNYFLVGLSRGGAEPQNSRLVAERNWFDMSILFVSGKIGKLTFEKGATGQRVFEDALKSWH